ncbi:ribose ABC transporter substrate-binding protein [Mycolicibacterium agri]|uniref:Ribose ABC transporter substrate-binding protein n=1 Tax=Mycolicibacterium agri TaxID=36811 RepID=A0A2A7MRE3_MYCAG|nr:ABC transporter substrate-binding protein [Mycolicibacterium agri]PEG34254.1 ribose ABC transporter substrate-binding protein [Mycolicibacterium agri]GFG49711.1 ribose ABC transporter substrate-binding protein [Mycolicibacterium agri]
MNRKRAMLVAGTLGSIVLAMSSCTSSKPQASEDAGEAGGNAPETMATTVAAPPKASKEYNIALLQGVAGDQFYITMQCGAQEEAAKLGVKLDTQGPQKFDPTLQKPILDSIVAARPDAVLVAPTDVKAMQQPLQQAAAAGIKVVLVDTTTEDPSYAVSEIASDNEGGGRAAFEAIKKLRPEGGKVMVMNVDPGVSTTDARAKGFEDAVKADSNFQYVGVQYSHNDPATAAQLIGAQLQKDPDLVGVFATNIFSAEGSATGVRQAGKAGQVSVVGFDAGPNQMQALRDGTVQALVAQDPGLIGKFGVDEAVTALDGGDNTTRVQTGFTIITQDNLNGEGGAAAYKSNC